MSNSNICDRNADCYNELGGYTCRCRSEYYGNGFTCYPRVASETVESVDTSETYETSEETWASSTDSTPSIPALAPEAWLCDQCSEHADCVSGVCICRNGWNGDGIECVYNCRDSEVWNIDRCEPINSGSDEEESELTTTTALAQFFFIYSCSFFQMRFHHFAILLAAHALQDMI